MSRQGTIRRHGRLNVSQMNRKQRFFFFGLLLKRVKIFFLFVICNGSQLAKMKNYILHISHEMYREKAVGLKNPIVLEKNMIFVKMRTFGRFRWKCIFRKQLLIQTSNLFFHIKFRFPFPILRFFFFFFTAKSPSVTRRSVCREKCFEKYKSKQNKTGQKQKQKPVAFFFFFFFLTIGSNNF